MDSLEQILRDLPRHAKLVKDRGYRQVWRFEHGGKGYFLKFYRRAGVRDAWRRAFRGSPASREFQRLQWLQKAEIPAPRAVACLLGFRLDRNKGDAVILQAIEPSLSLEDLFSDAELAGGDPADHRRLADQVIDLVYRLGQAGLGHADLHLGNFLLHQGKLFLIDAYAVHRGGLKTSDVLQLGASVGRFATTSDLLRGWRKLAGDAPMPQYNPVSQKLWRDSIERVGNDNRYFGHFQSGEWSGIFFRHTKHPRRWSRVSRLSITEADWERAWPQLHKQMTADRLRVLKRTRSGDVFSGEIELNGQQVEVVIKRPQRRYWYRYVNDIGRGPRPRRAWYKAWNLILRNLPTAWPIAVVERRRFGYAIESLAVVEKVPGPTLWNVNLEAMTPGQREMLFRRAGRILRQIERHGFSHFDAKASNWIVRFDESLGPSPVLIDVDGVRRRRWVALGVQRLLRSLRERRQYSPADSLSLCKGYAPYARISREDEPPAETQPEDDGVPVALHRNAGPERDRTMRTR